MTIIRTNADGRSVDSSRLLQYVELLQTFAAKLVLEVFGGCGAIWGFSEVCGLRTTNMESIRFWRSAAITVAALFAVRWFRQFHAAILTLLQKHQSISDSCSNNGNLRTPPTIRTDGTFRELIQEKSPFGIQLLSFFNEAEESIEIDEEEAALSRSDSCNEFTALASSLQSPQTPTGM